MGKQVTSAIAHRGGRRVRRADGSPATREGATCIDASVRCGLRGRCASASASAPVEVILPVFARLLAAVALVVGLGVAGAAVGLVGAEASGGLHGPGASYAWAAPAKDAQAQTTYWVSVSYQGSGSAEASARVEQGDSLTVHWNPDPGAEVLSVQVDGQDRPDLVGDGASGSVDFPGVTADHSVNVRFSASADAPADGVMYVVDTMIEGGPGWVSGAGLVSRGGSRVVAWEPEEGWTVAAVVVDGAARPDLASVGSTAFQRISADHSVTVVLEPDEAASSAGEAQDDDREATLFAQRRSASPTSPFPEPGEGAPRLVYDLVAAVHGGGAVSLVIGVVAFAALVSGAHVLSDRRRYYEEDRQEAEEAAAAERAERQAEADAYLAGYYDAYLAAYGDDAADADDGAAGDDTGDGGRTR